MASVAYTTVVDDVELKIVKWVLGGAYDTGLPFTGSKYPDKSVQMYGTWNASHVMLEGTNENGTPAHFLALNDHSLNPIELAADDVVQVLENCHQYRPRVVSGTATEVTVILCAKG